MHQPTKQKHQIIDMTYSYNFNVIQFWSHIIGHNLSSQSNLFKLQSSPDPDTGQSLSHNIMQEFCRCAC